MGVSLCRITGFHKRYNAPNLLIRGVIFLERLRAGHGRRWTLMPIEKMAYLCLIFMAVFATSAMPLASAVLAAGDGTPGGEGACILEVPSLDYAISPDPITVPYCQSRSVIITLTNSGPEASNVTNLRLTVSNLPDQLSVSNVSGATYSAGNSTFLVGDVGRGETREVAFDLGPGAGSCGSEIESRYITISPLYQDECGTSWRSPVKSIFCSADPDSGPRVIASISGPGSLFQDEAGEYVLCASYSEGECNQSQVSWNTLVDRYPPGFEVADSDAGIVDSAKRTITWKNVTISDGTAWNATILLRPSSVLDACACGNVYTNRFSVEASTECCECNLTSSAQQDIAVECLDDAVLDSSNKIATPSKLESCEEITYISTYTFDSSSTLEWSQMSFTEQGNNNQTFPDGSRTGPAVFETICGSVTKDITLGEPLNLAFMDEIDCMPGFSSEFTITYTLKAQDSGSFFDWSSLSVDGYGSGCPNSSGFENAALVNVSEANFTIKFSDLEDVSESCAPMRVTLVLDKNSTWSAKEMSLAYEGIAFSYVGPTTISGITNQSGEIVSFEPVPSGNIVVWDLGDIVSSGGQISFNVSRGCGSPSIMFAAIKYYDNCGKEWRSIDSYTPSVELEGDLAIDKIPEVVSSPDGNASWKIYVTNRGSGTDYNTEMVDVLGADLAYLDSKIGGQNDPANTTAVGQRITFFLGDLKPREQKVVTLNATVEGSVDLNNSAFVTWGCGSEPCQNVSDASRVYVVDSDLAVKRHEAEIFSACGTGSRLFLDFENAGEARLYNISVSESLPPGLEMVPGSEVIVGAVPTSSNLSSSPLRWWFNSSDGLAPGARVNITLSFTGGCEFAGGSAEASLSALLAAGGSQRINASNLTAIEIADAVLDISKVPESNITTLGSTVNWTIAVTNPGEHLTSNITLEDILPENVSYLSSDPPISGGSGSSSDPLTWALPDIPAGEGFTVNLSADVTGYLINGENRARVIWGCCPDEIKNATAVAYLTAAPSANSSVNISKSADYVDTCGGNYTIVIVNSGSAAITSDLKEMLPAGSAYIKGSAMISSDNASHSIASFEPQDFSQLNGTLVWNASNLDSVLPGETVTINLSTASCQSCCDIRPVSLTQNTVRYNYTDLSGGVYQSVRTLAITPLHSDLEVNINATSKTANASSWKITLDNSGDAIARNVTLTNVLGSGFSNVSAPGSVTHNDTPSAGMTTCIWSGLTVPVGASQWSVSVNASLNSSGDMTNEAFVNGTCANGCVYSQDSDFDSGPSSTFKVNITSEPGNKTIGDLANFTITAEFAGPGEDYNLTVLTNSLPSGLQLVNWDCGPGSDCGSFSSSGQNLTWDLGNFTGPSNVSINLSAVVLDVASNYDGAELANQVELQTFEGGELFSAQDSASLSIAEPKLNISASANRTGIEHGDAVRYTIAVRHMPESHSDAYDVNITDTVPEGLNLTMASCSSQPAADATDIQNNSIFWRYNSIPLGSTVTLLYNATANGSLVANQELEDNVTLNWTSKRGQNPYERFGGFTSLDNYNQSAKARINVSNNLTLDQLPDYDRNLTIGQEANYTVLVDMPRVLARNLRVSDTLPLGMRYENLALNVSGAAELKNVTQSAGASSNLITWSFGDVDNADGKGIRIDYRATVLDTEENRDLSTLQNRAELIWTDAGNIDNSLSDQANEVMVLEPHLTVSVAANKSELRPGEALQYVLTVSNPASGSPESHWDAFDVNISDLLPGAIDLVDSSSSPEANSTSITGQRVMWNYSRIPLGSSVTLRLNATVGSGAAGNSSLKNSAWANWTSTPGLNSDERYGGGNSIDDYNASSDLDLVVVEGQSSIELPDGPRTRAIGERANFTILVNLSGMQGENLSDLWANDTLPAGLKYDALSINITDGNGSNVSFSQGIPSLPNDGTAPVNINWSFGNASASVETIEVQFDALVADVPANQNGAFQENNTAELRWTDESGVQTASGHSGPITIVEPDLEIHMGPNVTEVAPGGAVQYSITVNHTANSTSPAFDINVTALIPEELKVTSATPGANGQTQDAVTWAIPVLNITENRTISYDATVNASTPDGKIIRSVVMLNWTSVPGFSADERTGNGTGAGNGTILDDYNRTGACEVDVELPPTYLGDFVWIDQNEDGIQDTGELGAAGVLVELYNSEDDLINATTTDALGGYNFTGLAPGSYSLEFALPEGYRFTSRNQGENFSLDSDANTITGRTANITLSPGQRDTTWDAGIYLRTSPPASLGDLVWLDSDEDGLQDAGEPGFARVVVNLYSEDVLIATTRTNATGIYNFTNLELRSYSVGFVPPQGYNLTRSNWLYDDTVDSDAYNTTFRTNPVALIPGMSDNTVDAGLVPLPASLGDFVWVDLDQNGIQDQEESGMVGVLVELQNSTGHMISNATTNDTGHYKFEGLRPGDYSIRFNLPEGYVFTAKNQGENASLDSDANQVTGVTGNIALSPGQNDTTWDAGIYIPEFFPASIGDFVWIDEDQNGVQDSGEAGLSGAVVRLYNSSGVEEGTTFTDSTGYYRFANLAPGSYYLKFDQPFGYNFSAVGQGPNPALDSDADQTTGKTRNITLTSGQDDLTWDAGVFPEETPLAALGDLVWLDSDEDGLQDSGEPGVAGATVKLYDTSFTGDAIGTTTTDASGAYGFSDLMPGDYWLEFVLPEGYQFTAQNQGDDGSLDSDVDTADGRTGAITLSAGQNDITWDAGAYASVVPETTASLGDFVWIDEDENGIQGRDELGLSDVTVRLYDSNALLASETKTDIAGYYSFAGLEPGSYSLEFVLPSGYEFTAQNQGSSSELDSDADSVSGKTGTIGLSAGQEDTTWDAGVYSSVAPVTAASLGGSVWIDENDNGIYDLDELGLSGATVSLFSSEDAKGTVLATAITSDTGHYSFGSLEPGLYSEMFILPPGYVFTACNQGTNPDRDSDADEATGITEPIVLAPGQNDMTWCAGACHRPVQMASLETFVWVDSDEDGVQGADEPGLAGATLNLYNETGAIAETEHTNDTGVADLENLGPGSYSLETVLPEGYQFSADGQGNNSSMDSDVDPKTGRTGLFYLASGHSELDLDVGVYRQDVPPSPDGSVSDMDGAIEEPVQFEQFCNAGKVLGSGSVDVSTSAIDRRVALKYRNSMAGEGDLDMESETAFSEKASKLNRNVTNKSMPMNFFEETKISFSGKTPLVGEKNLRSSRLFGGIGAEVGDAFSVNQLEGQQTMFFASTNPLLGEKNQSVISQLKNASPAQLVGSNTKNIFNGTWITEAKMHQIMEEKIESRRVFEGKFETERLVKFHEAPKKPKIVPPCQGIDC